MTSQPAGTGAASASSDDTHSDLKFFFAVLAVLVSGFIHLVAAVVQGMLDQTPGVLQGVLSVIVFFSLVWSWISANVAFRNYSNGRDNDQFAGMLMFIVISIIVTLAGAIAIWFFPQWQHIRYVGWVPLVNVGLFVLLLMFLQD